MPNVLLPVEPVIYLKGTVMQLLVEMYVNAIWTVITMEQEMEGLLAQTLEH